jgi:hypothetical protein
MQVEATLSQGISDIVRPCVFDKFHGSVPHHVAQEMYSNVHVTRAFAICGFSLEDVSQQSAGICEVSITRIL